MQLDDYPVYEADSRYRGYDGARSPAFPNVARQMSLRRDRLPRAGEAHALAGWAQTGKSDFYEPADSRLRGKAARGGQGV